MTDPVSTKPYLIRAIHEWCIDNGFTPYMAVTVDAHTQVPKEFVKSGEIVLNVSPLATNALHLGNELIEFQARFGGEALDVSVPVARVSGIFASENGQGMAFEISATPEGLVTDANSGPAKPEIVPASELPPEESGEKSKKPTKNRKNHLTRVK
ncbi:MAG: ClpXP protease specificity-enhancing factor [Limnobacter sp.]|nr:ClpXP protease specificity-enhancing factor [Limnobacter sp.]